MIVMRDFLKGSRIWFSCIGWMIGGLLGCDSASPYHKKNGEWYFESNRLGVPASAPLTQMNERFARVDGKIFYREEVVHGVDSATFVALDDHYGKDKFLVYFGDTHRDSREYFLVKRVGVGPIRGADSASFRVLKDGYAADATQAYFLGEHFVVRDVASFEVLEYGFTRDRIRGYNKLIEIPNSDGASFEVVDADYAKDATHVWYSFLDNDPKIGGMRSAVIDIREVDAASFVGKTRGYAVDVKRVYYRGRVIPGAVASTFGMLEPVQDGADAFDDNSRYRDGKRL